eukprot:jgi/Ulvmu1/10969/UM007_0148.1
MVNFKLLEVKGDYDFGSKSSEYKANVGIGRAELKLKHNLKSNCAKFELEGPLWEVGYDHKGKNLHAKKKWALTKNLLFIVRQDFPKLNFGVFPSPELQLEHVMKKLGTVSKMKHELKYDMFYKKSVLEQEICFAKYLKYKGAINSAAKWKGAAASLKADYGKPWLNELELKASPSKPMVFSYKIKPMKGLKFKMVTDSKSRQVSGEVEAEFESDGMKVELKQFVSAKGWSQPLLQIGFKF